jgi:7,8-dihydropterin-6-yl-methyl-4-(beta-D-ribofuranosyl)aminobenzene 5'-phosphate synthase
LIEAGEQRLLLDAGQSGDVLRHNMVALGLWQQPLHHLVLSHAHYDHTGGVVAVLAHWPEVMVHAHADIAAHRLSLSDRARSIGLSAELAALAASGAWHLADEPIDLAPGVTTTGAVSPRPYPMGRSPRHAVEREGRIVADDYADDLSLVLHLKGGVALLCGCCHAGLRNTILRLRAITDAPLVAVIGGTHLEHADAGELSAVAELLQREGCPQLHLCHCTGERAIQALRLALGDAVRSCPAGSVIELADAPTTST